jgi:hypothetical protein
MVAILLFTGHAKSKCAAYRTRNHPFFVRANDADSIRILSDTTGEHQRVQPARRRSECADPFLLDEPPLIVRMRGSAGFMGGPFVILQSERSQLRARTPVIRVKNASNP